jgi:hypothetical protein
MEITKEELLKELRDFRSSARLILRPDDIPAGIKPPPQWEPVISKPFGSFKAGAWPEWDPIVKKAPNIGRFLKSILRFNSVFLDQRRSLLYLLYVYTSRGRNINVYAGLPPAGEAPERIKEAFKHFPRELRDFYLKLHNGWTFLPDNAMGPLPLDDCAFISDDEFDFDDEKAAEAPFDPKKVLTVFHNGSGDYLCLNLGKLNQDGEASALIWWHEEPTKPDFVDFWPVLDAWMGIFFENSDHN